MNYKELNKIQRTKMNNICNNDYEMEWEEPNFMNIIMGNLPKIRRYSDDGDISKELYLLKRILLSYNPFCTDKDEFIKKVTDCLKNIHLKKPNWRGLNLFEINECMLQHEFCLISGEGGIGKSYFIKCFEENLELENIPHVCFYGKFEKDINNIDINEIIDDSQNGFVFVVDAINEMSESGQLKLLDLLYSLKKNNRIRIVITYRNNSMDNKILCKYKEIASSEHVFSGVSFEAALGELLKSPIPDIYKYEDILYSNNALLLSMLQKVLADEKIKDKTVNSISSVTFILESYIKNTINKHCSNLSEYKGVDIWRDTKNIAKWMYKNEKKLIDEESFLIISKIGNDFLDIMFQLGFMNEYELKSVRYFYFTIDSLTDFLIARSLFSDISKKSYDEQVEIIKDKIAKLYNLDEAIIIAIFDKFSPDYEYIKRILEATGLASRLNGELLLKINFNKEHIVEFLKVFSLEKTNDLLLIFGGYTDKPFNCVNYLKDYYLNGWIQQIELSKTLSGYSFFEKFKHRMKNILYFITLNSIEESRLEEVYSFALLCCASPNREIRCVAMKLLYEVFIKNLKYKNKLIEEYYCFKDFYIKEAIIYILANYCVNDEKISSFFRTLVKEDDSLSAKSIRRISFYLNESYEYINWDRKNLYIYNYESNISKFISDILLQMDLMYKDFLPFKYWGGERVDTNINFLYHDKYEISKINKILDYKFSNIKEMLSKGDFNDQELIRNKYNKYNDVLHMKSFLSSYEEVIINILNTYQIFEYEMKENIEKDFHYSLYVKCIDIATGLFYGSLMCNYYTDRFSTYNNSQNSIGYEVYDPIEYGEELYINSPIPIYNNFVEKLGDVIVNRIQLPVDKDIKWVKDVGLSKSNLISFFKPIEKKKEKWVMIAGRVCLQEKDSEKLKWKDTYNLWCCTSEDEVISNDGNARYLTIELNEYKGNLQDYSKSVEKSWLCKRINDIVYNFEILDNTSLVLPPVDIINFFNLKINLSDMSWSTPSGEKIILCNNNKNSYYKDPIGATIFMKETYLKEYLIDNKLKFFAFVEKYIPETGFADETSLHFEIQNSKIINEVSNSCIYR